MPFGWAAPRIIQTFSGFEGRKKSAFYKIGDRLLEVISRRNSSSWWLVRTRQDVPRSLPAAAAMELMRFNSEGLVLRLNMPKKH